MTTIIFDMDGVLLDSETISWKAWELTAKDFGILNIEKANEKCMGANRADTCTLLRSIYGKDFEAEKFLERTSYYFDQIERKSGIPLMPYAKEALEYLSKKYTILLASSTRKVRVYRQMQDAGLFDFFKTITTGDMVSHSKPDPEIYLKALESINEKAENAIAIEDSPNGVISATSAKIKTIMVPDKIQPDNELKQKCWKVISSLKEIQSFL